VHRTLKPTKTSLPYKTHTVATKHKSSIPIYQGSRLRYSQNVSNPHSWVKPAIRNSLQSCVHTAMVHEGFLNLFLPLL